MAESESGTGHFSPYSLDKKPTCIIDSPRCKGVKNIVPEETITNISIMHLTVVQTSSASTHEQE